MSNQMQRYVSLPTEIAWKHVPTSRLTCKCLFVVIFGLSLFYINILEMK